MTANPEIGKTVKVGRIATNYLEVGNGPPLVLIHGSGPGVTGFANWHGLLPTLSEHFHAFAPDMVGFGYTDCPADIADFTLDLWVEHVIGFLEAVGIRKASFIGNSFGGALTLALAARRPEFVDRMVLMGSGGLAFPMTAGLSDVWGYQPSMANMRRLMETFAYDVGLVTDTIVKSRYEASIRPGAQENFARLFPEPRQERLVGLSTPEEVLSRLPQRALVVHGREDKVIPLEVAIRLGTLLPNAETHIFDRCGHWTQIEKKERFLELIIPFLTRP